MARIRDVVASGFDVEMISSFLLKNILFSKLIFFISDRLDCGTGPGIVHSSSRVNLGKWNHLIVFRHDWGVWLQLNGGQREEGRSQVRRQTE